MNSVWVQFAACCLRLYNPSSPWETLWAQQQPVVSLREVLPGGTTDPVSAERGGTWPHPPVTQCVSIGCWELSWAWMWLLSRLYTIKTPQTAPSSPTLVAAACAPPGEATWTASAFPFGISRGEWWTPSTLSPITSTTSTRPPPSALSHLKAPRRPRTWPLCTATTSAACTTSRASRARRDPPATASGITHRLQTRTCGSTGRASTPPHPTCTETTRRRSSRLPTARSGSSSRTHLALEGPTWAGCPSPARRSCWSWCGRRTPTPRSSPWPSRTRTRRSWPWVRFISTWPTTSPFIRRAKPAGRTRSGTTCLWTTASRKCRGTRTIQVPWTHQRHCYDRKTIGSVIMLRLGTVLVTWGSQGWWAGWGSVWERKKAKSILK